MWKRKWEAASRAPEWRLTLCGRRKQKQMTGALFLFRLRGKHRRNGSGPPAPRSPTRCPSTVCARFVLPSKISGKKKQQIRRKEIVKSGRHANGRMIDDEMRMRMPSRKRLCYEIPCVGRRRKSNPSRFFCKPTATRPAPCPLQRANRLAASHWTCLWLVGFFFARRDASRRRCSRACVVAAMAQTGLGSPECSRGALPHKMAGDAEPPPSSLWTYRPPPNGLTSLEFRLCKQFEKHSSCRLGVQCVEAHGVGEFNEWVARWKILRDAARRRHTEPPTLLRRLHDEMQRDRDDQLFSDDLPGVLVQVKANAPCSLTLATKPARTKWTLLVEPLEPGAVLCSAALLRDNHREHFTITSVQHQETKIALGRVAEGQQEWAGGSGDGRLAITVKFAANVYGSFKQTLVLDFNRKPYLIRRFQVLFPAYSSLLKFWDWQDKYFL